MPEDGPLPPRWGRGPATVLAGSGGPDELRGVEPPHVHDDRAGAAVEALAPVETQQRPAAVNKRLCQPMRPMCRATRPSALQASTSNGAASASGAQGRFLG